MLLAITQIWLMIDRFFQVCLLFLGQIVRNAIPPQRGMKMFNH